MPVKTVNMCLFAIIAVSVLSVSQLTGYLVNTSIPVNSSIEINSLLNFTHIRNHGGVFGMFQGRGWVFAGFSVAILSCVIIYLLKADHLKRYEFICFGFIVGGGASNILDRFIYGSVIDFIDIQQIPFWNYVFNTADVMIHLGIWPLLILSLLPAKNQQQVSQ